MTYTGQEGVTSIASLEVEHEALDLILERAGICRELGERPFGIAPLLIAWSPREAFLLRPEYAWLSQPEATFIQMPISLELFRQTLSSPRARLDAGSNLARLLTPRGQWHWAVDRLQQALYDGRWQESLQRLEAMRDFAHHRWPGIFEAALAVVRSKVDGRQSDTSVAGLSDSVEDIEAAESCGPVLNWSARHPFATRINELRDLLCYAVQELTDTHAVIEEAKRDPWWQDLTKDVATSQEALALITPLGANGRMLQDCCEAGARSLRAIAALDTSLGLTRGEIEKLAEATEALVSAIDRIAETSARVRSVKIALAGAMDGVSV